MTPEAANVILSRPNATDTRFIAEALRAFQSGIQNDKLALSRLDPNAISKGDAEILFDLGRKAVEAKAKAAEDAVYNTYQRAKGILQKSGKKPVGKLRIAEGVDVEGFDEVQRASADLAAKIAPSLHIDIVLYEDENPQKFGYYKASEDAVYLNVNARWSGNSMMTFTLAHELVHRAKTGSPRKFKAFADFLVSEYGKAGVSVEELVAEQLAAAKAAEVKLTEEEAFEEVICDAAQRMLTDTDAGKKLAAWGHQSKENNDFLQKLKQWLTELFDNLRVYFKDADNDSKSANAFRKLDKNVQQILSDMFVDMSTDAAEKLGTIKAAGMLDKINTTGEGGVRYSIVKPFVDNNGVSYKDAVLLDSEFFNDLKPNNWGKKLQEFVDFRSNNYPLILPVQDENGVNQQLEFAKVTDRVYDNNNSPHRVLNELSQTTDNISKLSVIHIDEIVEISEADNPYFTVRDPNHSHKWLDQNGWLHRTAYVINSKNGAIYKIVVDIAKAADGRHIMYATKGKINRVGTVLVNSLVTRGSGLNTNSAISLAQQDSTVKRKDLEYLYAVQQGDMKTVLRMVYEAAKDAGYSVKAWHGTPIKGITVFDPKKIGSTTDEGIFGNGFYFTTSKITADGYATDRGATMPVFLDVGKSWWGLGHSIPEVAKLLNLDESVLTVRRTAMGSVVAPLPKYARTFSAHLIEKGYDSVIVQHNANNYEVVIFNNTRIKSADPVTYDKDGNVIPLSERFNPTKRDIRYKVSAGTAENDFDYSQLNWARDAGIITGKDVAIFERTINNEIYRGAKPQTANGEYIIDTGRCLMFTDGDFHNPTLSRVIVFATEYESLTADAKEMIRDDAATTGDIQESIAFIKESFGDGFVSEISPQVLQTNGWQNRGRKGAAGTGSNQGYRAKSLRERLAEEGLSHLLDDDASDNKLSVGASRKMLVDAFEGMAQSPEERRLVDTYRNYLVTASGIQSQLQAVRKEIRQKVNSKAPKTEIDSLRSQAESLQAELDANDSALLSLEAAKPLRDLMDRAIKKETQKQLETQRKEMAEKYQESRHKAVEGRKATELRHKIRRLLGL